MYFFPAYMQSHYAVILGTCTVYTDTAVTVLTALPLTVGVRLRSHAVLQIAVRCACTVPLQHLHCTHCPTVVWG